MTDELEGVIGSVARKFFEYANAADIFFTQGQQMKIDNYLRAYEEELVRLGEGHEDEAIEAAKSRDPEGYDLMSSHSEIWDSLAHLRERPNDSQ